MCPDSHIPLTVERLKPLTAADIRSTHHQFSLLLRRHTISSRERAFDRFINLLLCKITDEKINGHDLQFRCSLTGTDTSADLLRRLESLYRQGMQQFMAQPATCPAGMSSPGFCSPGLPNSALGLHCPAGCHFTFLDTDDPSRFERNIMVVNAMVKMLQDFRFRDTVPNQFLGDMFELFLDRELKQTNGQFFTPLPLVRFIARSLPLESIFTIAPDGTGSSPKVLDYACGAGHFLTGMATELQSMYPEQDPSMFHHCFHGVEKDDRLCRVARVATLMKQQEGIQFTCADALTAASGLRAQDFAVLVSNPPYSVRGFLETLPETDIRNYQLSRTVPPDAHATSHAIEIFFLERAAQLLAPHGLAALILPSSVLFNTTSVYIQGRRILLQYFEIIAMAEFGPGTFSHTGTNTILFFLRRRDDRDPQYLHLADTISALFTRFPSPSAVQGELCFPDVTGTVPLPAAKGDDRTFPVAGGERLLTDYCTHLGIPEKLYRTLLDGNPSPALLQTRPFDEYTSVFTGFVSRKKRGQKTSPVASCMTFGNRTSPSLAHYIQSVEHEKMFCFALSRCQSTPVLIIRSPITSSASAMREFLGYSWSRARGRQGICYPRGTIDQIQTPLFDPHDRHHPERISTLVRQNFMGILPVVPDCLQPWVTTASLTSLLDFNRGFFDWRISLTALQSPSSHQNPISVSCDEEVKRNGMSFLLESSRRTEHFVSLDELVTLVSTPVDPSRHQGMVFCIGLENIGKENGMLTGNPMKDFSSIKSTKTAFQPGDILYGKLRPNLRKVYLARQHGICSTEILVLRPLQEGIGSWLSRYLLGDEFTHQVMMTMGGQQFPRTSWAKIRRLPIPLASGFRP